MTELKPCPFCGGKDIEVFRNDIQMRSPGKAIDNWDVECPGCCELNGFDTEQEAITAWNKRHE